MDPLVSLAFSMHNAKGVYAVLLGSGVSSAARIPTGWAIVLDLIHKLALLSNEVCHPDPETWFRNKFKAPPGYSQLLERLGNTCSERQAIIKAYIEPTQDERNEGYKVPTQA